MPRILFASFSSVLGVLQAVLAKCVDGAKIVDLCQTGDTLMLEETAKVYKKEKDLKKGRCITLGCS